MAHPGQHDVAQAEQDPAISGTSSQAPANDIQLLPITILKMLEPYVKEASIELKNGERVSINQEWPVPTQFHCGEEQRPCAEVEMVEAPGGELFALCKKLVKMPGFASHLERVISSGGRASESRFKLLPIIPVSTGESYSAFGENAEARQGILAHIIKVVQGMGVAEKSNLLSLFGETEFNVFLEKDEDLEKLQSIKYGFNRRINKLKTQIGAKKTKRPVKEQRRVEGYLYILQPGQKGGDYWYVQYTVNGRRKQIYLGKERPTFEPSKDLARKQKVKSKSASTRA